MLIFIISVWVLSIVTFYVSRLAPGDPLVSYYGERVEKMSPEEREWAEDVYKRQLLQSLPVLSEGKEWLPTLPGMPPTLIHPPKGDAFAERNVYACLLYTSKGNGYLSRLLDR